MPRARLGELRAVPGADATLRMTGGASYRDGSWTPTGSFTPTFAPRFAFSGEAQAQARCSAGPVVSLLIADVVGPALEVGPYVDARARVSTGTTPPYRADLGIGLLGRVHGKVHVLSWTVADLDTTLIDERFVDMSWP